MAARCRQRLGLGPRLDQRTQLGIEHHRPWRRSFQLCSRQDVSFCPGGPPMAHAIGPLSARLQDDHELKTAQPGELKFIDDQLNDTSALLVDAENQLQSALAEWGKDGPDHPPSEFKVMLAREYIMCFAAYKRQLMLERPEAAAMAAGEAIAMAAGLRPAPAAVQDFWRCLPGAVIDANGFLRLAVGTTFLGCTHDVLLVRKSYIELYSKMLRRLAWPRRGFLITGGPGIGKTFFSYYLMYLLAKDGHTVLYESDRDPGKVLLFRSTGIVLQGIRFDFEDELADSKCWYIVDGLKPAGYASARTVVIATTPMHKFKYKDFLKCSYVLNLPTWSRDEIDA